jgi:hypothetical protein
VTAVRAGSPLTVAAALFAALVASGCASIGAGGDAGPPAPAPQYRVGDRWVYRIVDGFRTPVTWDETHEVASIEPGLITVRVAAKGPTIDVERIEKWSAPGVVLQGAVYEAETRRFEPPLVRFRFPLTPGERWNQRVRDLDAPPGPYGPIVRFVTVGGWRQIATPAGTFDAIGMRVTMTLDDETFWRFPTQADYLVWYAPAVGAAVREERRSQWRDKGGQDAVGFHPGQNATVELVSFTRGR